MKILYNDKSIRWSCRDGHRTLHIIVRKKVEPQAHKRNDIKRKVRVWWRFFSSSGNIVCRLEIKSHIPNLWPSLIAMTRSVYSKSPS